MSKETELPRTVYLFGAGASAKAIPINSGENNIFDEIETTILGDTEGTSESQSLKELLYSFSKGHFPSKDIDLVKQIEPLINDYRDILRHGRDFPTIDFYLYSLSINDLEQYLRKKVALCLFFLYYHYKNSKHYKFQTDPRYLDFFGTLHSLNKDIHHNFPVTILLWNYDIQPELAYYKLFNEQNLKKVRGRLNMHEIQEDATVFNSARLNGSVLIGDDLHLATLSEKEAERNHEDFDNLLVRIILKRYLYGISGQKKIEMKFNWEPKHDPDQLIKHIDKSLAEASELVICGYSFPRVNRNTDIRLLERMKNLKKIILQYTYEDEFERNKDLIVKMLRSFHDWPERKKRAGIGQNRGFEDLVVYEASQTEFYIPDEYIT